MGDEAEAVEVVRQGEQVDVSIPGSSGHHQPGARADLVQGVLDDHRVTDAEHVTVVVPRGDHEALLAVKDRLPGSTTRPAGSSVIVESDLGRDGPRAG